MVLNVRLGPEEDRLVKGLRRARVNVSALVRRAIREAARTTPTHSPRAIVEEIILALPVPDGVRPHRPPLDDRKALKAYLRKRIRRR